MPETTPQKTSVEIFFPGIVFELFLGAVGIMLALFTGGRFLPAEIFGPHAVADLFSGLFWGIAVAIAAGTILVFVPAVRRTRTCRAILPLAVLTLPQALLIALCAGIGEEFLFRGAVQSAWGIWIASLLFALAHPLSIPYLFIAFIAGLGLGQLYQSSGALLAPILAHGAYDFLLLALLSRGIIPADPEPESKRQDSDSSQN